MDIFIREVGNRGVYDAFLDGELLVRQSRTPLLTAARSLLALGFPPGAPLSMWRKGRPSPDMASTVGGAAKYEVEDSNYSRPHLRAYRADKTWPSPALQEATE